MERPHSNRFEFVELAPGAIEYPMKQFHAGVKSGPCLCIAQENSMASIVKPGFRICASELKSEYTVYFCFRAYIKSGIEHSYVRTVRN